MGTSLTGVKIKDSYDSLLKVTDNGPLDGTLQTITDGLGNNSSLSLSTAGASVTGTLAVSDVATLSSNGNTFGNAGSSGRAVIIQAGSSNQAIQFKNSAGGDATLYVNGTSSSVDYNFNTYSKADALVIKNDGNIGIGTTSPDKASWGSKTLTIEGPSTSGVLELGRSNSTTTGNLGVLSFYNVGNAEMVDLVAVADGAANSGALKIFTLNAGVYGERMRIDSSGQVSIGKSSSNNNPLQVSNGSNMLSFNWDVNGAYLSSVNNPNTVYKGLQYDGSEHRFLVSASERVRVTSNGLTFNGDTSSANALDDYEEGTWTPAFVLGGGSVTYTTQTGTYTKIGRLVTIQMRIEVNVATTPSSTLEVTSLPFTVSTGSKGAISIWATGMDAASKVWAGIATPSTNNLRIYTYDAGSVLNPAADLQNGCVVNITATYEV